MASLEAVTEALTRLDLTGMGGAGSRILSDDERRLRIHAYLEALEELSDADLRAAVKLATRSANPFLPTPGQLIEFVRPRVSVDAAVTEEACNVYHRILAVYEGGGSMSYRSAADVFGPEAAAAFMATGPASFEWCEPGRDQQFRQKRFIDAFREAVESRHAERAALHAGADARSLPRGEATQVLARIAQRSK